MSLENARADPKIGSAPHRQKLSGRSVALRGARLQYTKTDAVGARGHHDPGLVLRRNWGQAPVPKLNT